jgi:hypothetical protein
MTALPSAGTDGCLDGSAQSRSFPVRGLMRRENNMEPLYCPFGFVDMNRVFIRVNTLFISSNRQVGAGMLLQVLDYARSCERG